jgi:hypothetical protein
MLLCHFKHRSQELVRSAHREKLSLLRYRTAKGNIAGK